MTYRMKKVGQIADTLTGYPFDSNLFDDAEGFPLIRIRDLKNGGTHTFYKGSYNKEFVVSKGDFLIGMDGEFNLVEWKSGDALLNQRVCKLTITDAGVSRKYLYYFLPRKLKEIEVATPFVTVKHLSHKRVLDIDVPLPPLPIQEQIAAILEKADAVREKRRQAKQLTEQFLRSAFLEMFGDPGINTKRLPTKRLADLVRKDDKINYGVVQPGDDFPGGVPIVRIGDFQGMHVDKTNLKRIDPKIEAAYKRSRLVGDEVLLACVGSIGMVALADPTLKGFNTVRAVARIRSGEEMERLFLAFYLSTSFSQSFFRRETRTVSQPTLNIRQIEETQILLPLLKEQQKFAALVEKVYSLRSKQGESEKELENLFQSLMQRAFRGELVQ